MLLRRVIHHFKNQEWTAIGIDFVIVVIGVFVGIQVSNWNSERADEARAHAYLARIGADIDADLSTYQDRLGFWKGVSAYGATGLTYAETGNAKDATQWDLLLAYFQSSQVAEFYTTDATFEELKSAGELGLIKDTHFRNALAQYYSSDANPALSERPRYREHIRGIIPLDIQNYIWSNCYSSDKASIQKMLPCKSPLDEKQAAAIVDEIRNDKALMAELRYWMSTMRIAVIIAMGRIESATQLRSSLNTMTDDSPKEGSP